MQTSALILESEVFVDIILNSFLLVFAGEMGDKTQLLSLVLAVRYQKPWTILAGVFVATIFNHFLAAGFGDLVSAYVPEQTLKLALGILFLLFAGWVLIPDKDCKIQNTSHWGAFMTTLIAFFIAEMGDKTQLATIALGASYSNTLWVTLGSTLGMVGANALAVFCGPQILQRIPMKWVRLFAACLFFIFGLLLLLGA